MRVVLRAPMLPPLESVMWTLLITTALAGYGDAVDGVPSPGERELHAWTDVARVDVAWFRPHLKKSEPNCWDKFTAAEKAPHAPLAWSLDLADAARFHTEDQARTNELSHESSDGTSFQDRLESYYQGNAIGENVAYTPGFEPMEVVAGWLCSDGHRANLLSDDFLELGTGEDRPYWTQDFGAAGHAGPVLRMGAHSPEVPSGTATLLASFGAARAPERVDAILDGDRLPMAVLSGTEARGVWSVDVEVDDACHLYWFTATLDSGAEARFPEVGAYGFGDCDWDDREAQWVDAAQVAPIEQVVPPPVGCGCATTSPAAGSSVGWAAALVLLARRRRR